VELYARVRHAVTIAARRTIDAWRHHYNEERPHSALDYQTPAAFAKKNRRRGSDLQSPPAPCDRFPVVQQISTRTLTP
jgi:putative transposase